MERESGGRPTADDRTAAVTPLQVAATYIGTAVGAGFATGQEILQFFCYFGAAGAWGVAVAALLLGLCGYAALDAGRRLGAASYARVIRHVAGEAVGRCADYLITAFLMGALVVMVAGSGALVREQLGWDPLIGGIAMAVASLATVLLGLQGIIGSMSFIVPLMFILMVATGVLSAASTGFAVDAGSWSNPASAPVPSWPLSAAVYASYNLVLTVAVLAPLGAMLRSRRAAAQGAAVGGLGLGAAALSTYASIVSRLPEAAAHEVPMLFVADSIHPLAGAAYGAVVAAAIYTTAISALYGFVSRLAAPESPGGRLLAVAATGASVLLARTGFTAVVRVLYPAVGMAGLVLMAGLLRGLFGW